MTKKLDDYTPAGRVLSDSELFEAHVDARAGRTIRFNPPQPGNLYSTATLAEVIAERDEWKDEAELKEACIKGMREAADKLAAERDAALVRVKELVVICDGLEENWDENRLAISQLQSYLAAARAEGEKWKKDAALMLETLVGIANADWRTWGELASPEEFVRWAKSRANHAAIQASKK